MIEIIIDGGKYKFYTKEGDYRIYIDRYDEKEWVTIESGSKAVLCLLQNYDTCLEMLAGNK